jgi:hypothetical protein
MSWKPLPLFALAGWLAACHDDDGPDLVALAGPQVATVHVELASGAVSVPAQPQAWHISGSAAYDDPTDTLTVALTARNRSTLSLGNPKVLVGAVSDGATAGDGTYADAGLPYISFGPESLAPNASATRDIVLTGVTGAGTSVAFDVDLRDGGWLFTPAGWDVVAAADAAGSGEALLIDVAELGPYGDATQLHPGTASPNGRYVDFAMRNQPAVARLDLTTFTLSTTKSLMGGTLGFTGGGPPGFVDALTPSPNGELVYAVVNEGAHRYRHHGSLSPPNVRLVRLKAKSLGVSKKLLVFPSTVMPGPGGFVEYRGRKLSITADGARGALPVTALGMVYLVDLETLALVDVDPGTSGEQGFDVSSVSAEPRFAAIAPDGASIYVTFSSSATPDDGVLTVIDVATGALSPLAPPTTSSGVNNPQALELGPDGRLYYARNVVGVPGLSIYDPVGDTWIENVEITACGGVAFDDGVYLGADLSDGVVHVYDTATDAELPSPGAGALGVAVPGTQSGHGLVLSGG